MSDRRVAKKASALLSSSGYLRLSSDLVPKDGKDLAFIVTPLPQQRKLLLRIISNGLLVVDGAKRKALYSNAASRCPMVTVKSAMKFLGIRLPKTSKEFSVTKKGDVLTVQF